MPQKTNELFWAFVIAIAFAAILGAIAFLVPRPDTATQAMFRLADSLVTGALGFFAGSALRASKSPQSGDAPE
jgi:hypothetical protein